MSADLAIAIKVGASVGAALGGLRSLVGGTRDLTRSTALLEQEYRRLDKAIERASKRGQVYPLHQLKQQQAQLEQLTRSMRANQQSQGFVQTRLETGRQHREAMRSQAMGAMAALGVMAFPVKLSMDFESSMADVRKTVDFDTPQQFKQMEQDLLALTHRIPMSAKELAAIAASGGQLGIARQDLAGFTETIAKMGVAFDMPAEQAGDAMAKLANVYKIPIAQIGKLGDAINHLSNSSPAKASDIVNTLSRVGGVAKQFGLTELQTASLSNAFIALGKTPEVAGTAINGMLTKLMTADKQGAKFQAALKGMGTDAKTLKKAIAENGEQALIDFLRQVEKLPKEGQMGALVDLFGLEYADDVAALVGGLDTYRQSVEALQKTGKDGLPEFSGSMEREFAARSATTANNLQLFKNQLSHLAISIGSVVLPALNGLLNHLKPLIDRFIVFAESHPALIKSVFLFGAALASVSAVSLVTRYGLSLLGMVIWGTAGQFLAFGASVLRVKAAIRLFQAGRMASAFRLLGLGADNARLACTLLGKATHFVAMGWRAMSVALLTNPLTWVVLALAAAAFLIYKYWQPIKGFFAGLWDGLKQGLEPVAPMLDGVAAVLSGLWIQVQPYVQPIMDWFADFFSVTQVAEGGARSFGQAVGQFIGGALAAVVGFAGNAMLQIQAAFNGGLNGILNLIVNWSPLGAFYSAFAAVLSWFGITLPAQFSGFGGMIMDGLINGIKSGAARAAAAIQNVANNLTTRFKSALRIHSPSRVFVGLGGFITQGLDLGLSRGAAAPVSTVGAMAGRLKNRFAERMGQLRSDIAARVSGSSADFAAARAQQAAPVSAAASGALTVHFSPTIHAPGGDPAQIQTAVQMGLREFEQLFNRLMADRERRSY